VNSLNVKTLPLLDAVLGDMLSFKLVMV